MGFRIWCIGTIAKVRKKKAHEQGKNTVDRECTLDCLHYLLVVPLCFPVLAHTISFHMRKETDTVADSSLTISK